MFRQFKEYRLHEIMRKGKAYNMADKGYTLSNYCEIDEEASKSYCAIHNEPLEKNLGDITKVDEKAMKKFTMICGGSPCQDFSAAGAGVGSVWKCEDCGKEYNPLTVHFSKRDKCKNCGSTNLNKSRSSLLVEWLRVIKENKPKWGIYENVKAITGKKFSDTFNMFIKELDDYGYNVYWKVLNARDYGIPQNRERVFVFMVLKELDTGTFAFPDVMSDTRELSDFLEMEVGKKYNTKDVRALRVITDLNNENSLLYDTIQIGREGKSREYNAYSPTLTSRDWKEPRIVNMNRLEEIHTGKADYSTRRLRKMLTLEYFRLMGFSDEEFFSALLGGSERAEAFKNEHTGLNAAQLLEEAEELQKRYGMSNKHLYMQAGNSIVVDVLYSIYAEIYRVMPYLFDDLILCSFFSGLGAFESGLNKLFESLEDINTEDEQQYLHSLL